MTTFTIKNSVIEEKYTKDELKKKFLFFMQTEMKEETIDLYQISIDELPSEVKKSYENFENINFVKR